MRIAVRKGPHDLSFLTNYRPNFCTECGAKIVRLRWRVWSSRRFCDKCSARFAKADWLRSVVGIVMLVLLGLVLGRGLRREPPPLVIQRTATSTPSSATASPTPTTVEQLYTCGARTKKGTPCSRRVHGPVRCWQHKGAKAMLPLEKLVVKE
jgi:ribosomal protein L37AE/L43A